MTSDKPSDARTVLPGQPVTYHPTTPPIGAVWSGAGCIAFGPPIPAQPDPSQIVGVLAVDDVCSCGRARGSEVHAAAAVNGHLFEARGGRAAPPTDAEIADQIRDAIRNGENGERPDGECRHMLDWMDRAEAALRRVDAIEENGYDPITDAGAPR